MYKFAGKAMDTTDDPSLVDESNMPEFIKQASDNKDIAQLSRDEFALVIKTSSEKDIPKFPVNDPANAWRSQQAFCKNAHLLGPYERVVAAKYIKEACDRFFVDTENVIEKLSAIADKEEIDSNLSNGLYGLKKEDEYSEEERILSSENIMKAAKAKMEHSNRDSLSSSNYALNINGQNRYPLFNEQQVKEANSYFDNHYLEMSPKQRREYSVKVASKSRKMGIGPSEMVQKYASNDYSKNIDAAIQSRKDMFVEGQASELYDILLEKKAYLKADKFADILYELDEKTGLSGEWDISIHDPYVSSLGKTASKMEDYEFELGDCEISGLDLGKLSEHPESLAGYFDPRLVAEFTRNPIVVFESLPVPQKKIIMKAAKEKLPMRTAGHVPATADSDLDEMARGHESPKDISTGSADEVEDYAASRKVAEDLMLLTKSKKKLVNPEKEVQPEKRSKPGTGNNSDVGLDILRFTYAGEYPTKISKIIQKAKVPKSSKKGLLGEEALKPVIPVGPSATGVRTPSSRLVSSPNKFAKIKEVLLRKKMSK